MRRFLVAVSFLISACAGKQAPAPATPPPAPAAQAAQAEQAAPLTAEPGSDVERIFRVENLDRGPSFGPKTAKVTCPAAPPVLDLIEDYSTASVSGLHYDAAANQYNYVWKSDKAWAGTCRQLSVKLIDGTTHVANFKFLK